jgi:hypothetical protein
MDNDLCRFAEKRRKTLKKTENLMGSAGDSPAHFGVPPKRPFSALLSVRIAQFCEDFTTDGRGWTRMARCFLSVFISVHPWFSSLVAAARAAFFAVKSAIRPDASGHSAMQLAASSRMRPLALTPPSCLMLTIQS